MPDSIKGVEGMTLSNVCDGELEKSFQDELCKFVETVEDVALYEVNGQDALVCKVVCEVELQFHCPTQVVSVGTRTNFKDAKRKVTVRSAFLRAGAVVVQPQEQMDLAPVHHLRPAVESDEGGEE